MTTFNSDGEHVPQRSWEGLEHDLVVQRREVSTWRRRAEEAERQLSSVRKAAVKVLDSHGGAEELDDLDALLTRQRYPH